MIVSLMVAAAENNVIGKDNDMVWHMPADMRYFMVTTLGHYVIMGRKTLESFGKALPKRTNVIVTRNKNYQASGCITVASIEQGLRMAEENGEKEAFIIGGGDIYRQSMHIADRIYLTRIHAVFSGDAFFPEIDLHQWRLVKSDPHPADKKNPYAYDFRVYERFGK